MLRALPLAAAQEIDRAGDVLAIVGENGVRDGRAQVAAGARAQDLPDIGGVLVHAEGEDSSARNGFRQARLKRTWDCAGAITRQGEEPMKKLIATLAIAALALPLGFAQTTKGQGAGEQAVATSTPVE
jgi:hypothetical protein